MTMPLPTKNRPESTQSSPEKSPTARPDGERLGDRTRADRPTRKAVKNTKPSFPWVWVGAGVAVVACILGAAIVLLVGQRNPAAKPPAPFLVTESETKGEELGKAKGNAETDGLEKPRSENLPPEKPPVVVPIDNPPPISVTEKGFKKGEKILFDGVDLSSWVGLKGETPHWKVMNGYVEAAQGDIRTKSKVGSDFQLRVEFWVPPGSKSKKAKGSGESGIIIQNRYKIQIADSYGVQKPTDVDCGALANHIAPSRNVSKPAGEWQTFVITFHGPRIESFGKLTSGRLTVVHNGVTIINNAAVDPMPE